jgi:hypothetical protein
MGEYTTVTRHGEPMPRRTLDNLRRVEKNLGVTFYCFQGTGDGSLSGGTHTGPGVVDLNMPDGRTPERLVRELRDAGFAAWYRTEADGFDPHIHAVDIASVRLSGAAMWQVGEYLQGGDGLTGSNLDRQAYRTVAGDWYPYTGRHGFDWQAWNKARTLRDRLASLNQRIRALTRTRKRVRRTLQRLS